MDLFNTAAKALQSENVEQTINGIRVSKTKSLTSNINGVIKTLTIHNLPDTYKAVIGIEDNDTIKIKDKKIYGKYYIKIYDTFNREINDFITNHRLAAGLSITLKLSNIDSPSVLIKKNDEKYGYFNSDNEEFNLVVYDDKAIEISSSKASSPDNADPSTWWVIGGIIAGVIVIGILSYLYYLYSVKSYFPKDPALSFKPGFGKPETIYYNTPRFPPRYYDYK